MRALTIRRITSRRKLNPARRHRSYPRVVKRARHNSYRVKRPGDTGVRHPDPPQIDLVNLTLSAAAVPETVSDPAAPAQTNLQLIA